MWNGGTWISFPIFHSTCIVLINRLFITWSCLESNFPLYWLVLPLPSLSLWQYKTIEIFDLSSISLHVCNHRYCWSISDTLWYNELMLPNLTASIFDSSAMSRVIVPNGNVKKLKRASTKSFPASAYITLLLSVHQNSQPNFVILKFSRIRIPVSYVPIPCIWGSWSRTYSMRRQLMCWIFCQVGGWFLSYFILYD